jgi:hypothetical protein
MGGLENRFRVGITSRLHLGCGAAFRIRSPITGGHAVSRRTARDR